MRRGLIGLLSVSALTLLAGCGNNPKAEPSCPSLMKIGPTVYAEVDVGTFIRDNELGDDAIYPECDNGTPVFHSYGGFAADSWQLRGVDSSVAFVAYRQHTRTFVVYARQGADLDTLRQQVRQATP